MIDKIKIDFPFLIVLLFSMQIISCTAQDHSNSEKANVIINDRIVNPLVDSLEHLSVKNHEYLTYSVHIGCVSRSDCKDHKVFSQLLDELVDDDWISIIKGNYNPAMKGYAFIALTFNNFRGRTELYKPYHRGLTLMIGHIYDDYKDDEAEEFIKEVNTKSVRWISARNGNKVILDREEKEGLKIENKIRKEQGVDTIKID